MKNRMLKSSHIRAGMAKRWSDPEWAIMWEVGEGTGLNSGRYADAVMMSLWPSRGLELHGVEIKVSRSDWKREAADPTKAEAIARYCDRWWVHTPPGVLDDLSDLPPAWGLREYDGKSWKTLREAEKTDAEPTSRKFLAAMLRRSDGLFKGFVQEAIRDSEQRRDEEVKKLRDSIGKQIQDGIQSRTEHLSKAADNVAKFEAAFGKGRAVDFMCDPEAWGRAARSLAGCRDGYGRLTDRLRLAADEIDALSALSGGGET